MNLENINMIWWSFDSRMCPSSHDRRYYNAKIYDVKFAPEKCDDVLYGLFWKI